MKSYALTTIDNPFDPRTQFTDWYNFDESKGYHTCSLLARVAITSSELSELDQSQAVLMAIEEIIKFDGTGLYKMLEFEEDEPEE